MISEVSHRQFALRENLRTPPRAYARQVSHGYLRETRQVLARAEKWARLIEYQFDNGGFIDRSATERTTLSEILMQINLANSYCG